MREVEKFLKSLVSLFSAIKPTNKRPDAIAENGTTLLLLEHFQFDNSRLNKKEVCKTKQPLKPIEN